MATQPPPPPPTPTPTGGNTINITACDNQIIIIAYQDIHGSEVAYEICNIQNGFNNKLNVTINLSEGNYSGRVDLNGVYGAIGTKTATVNLPKGPYSLLLLGINWGGGQQYIINVNGTNHGIIDYVGNGTPGLAYSSQPIDITV